MLRLWSFAVSRSGLGLTEREFWATTPRELSALRGVWLDQSDREEYRHASLIATLYNAHFSQEGIPWTADDLLGKTDRKLRKREVMADKMATRRIMIRASQNGPLPDWVTELEANRKNQRVN